MAVAAVGGPKILHVLPRGMRFSRSSATSIDLFVHEMATHSRFCVEVAAETRGDSLAAPRVHELPRYDFANTLRRAEFIARLAREISSQLIVVQQHLPSAAAIARRVHTPVLLQRHNFLRPPSRTPLLGRVSRARHAQQLNALNGLTFVSEAVLAEFERDWPEVTTLRTTIPNAIDFDAWSPSSQREPLVIAVGRATPDKGLVEAALALQSILPARPEWKSVFVVSEPERNPAYFAELSRVASPLGGQLEIRVNRPFSEVKALNEIAAIALIPSRWREPFGRTCLEAIAGGSAVVSSGSGGLREISDAFAIYAKPEPPDIAAAVLQLIDNSQMRAHMADAAHKRALQLFNLPRVAGTLDDFCAEVMTSGMRAKDRG